MFFGCVFGVCQSYLFVSVSAGEGGITYTTARVLISRGVYYSGLAIVSSFLLREQLFISFFLFCWILIKRYMKLVIYSSDAN